MFDVLHFNGRDFTGLPYRERRGILEGLDLNGATSEVAASPAWFGADGKEILQAMVDVAMEGIVCKARGSSYRWASAAGSGSRRRTDEAATSSSEGTSPAERTPSAH